MKLKLNKINWKNPNQKISEHFTVGDVTNHEPDRIPSNLMVRKKIKKFAKELDVLQEKFGTLQINSWYRPRHVNDAVGGSKNSQHISGWAADIVLEGKNARLKREFEMWLDKNWNGGVGLGIASGKGYTHIDMGPKRRWMY